MIPLGGVRRCFRASAALLVFLAAPMVATGALAQSVDCGEYRGLVCEGLFTDEANLVDDPTRISEAIARVTESHGNPFAVVIATDTRGEEPSDFAANLANSWGVGDPVEENGILVLVAIDERRTEIVTQEGIEVPGRSIANAGRSFLSAGDFEGGVLAIIGAVDQVLSGNTTPDGADDGGSGISGWFVIGLFVVPAAALGFGTWLTRHRASRRRLGRERDRRIDRVLDLLEPRGDEIAVDRRYALPPEDDATAATGPAIQALFDITADRASTTDRGVVAALARVGAVTIVDADALVAATRVPLELRASNERAILETGLEGAIDDAKAVPLSDTAGFSVAVDQLEDVVRSLRPHRIAAAQRRAADALVDRLVETPAGRVTVGPLGAQLMRSAPVLDPQAPIAAAAVDIQTALRIAADKVARVTAIRSRLSMSRTRDVAAIALADMSEDTDVSVDRFGVVLDDLETLGDPLRGDGISLPAVAALLLLNNSVTDIGAFVDGYRRLRTRNEPPVALEAAVAGLYTEAELRAVDDVAGDLGIPIAVAVAIRERRDDGVAVYRRLLSEIDRIADPEDARVIAGILAVSLEPAIAIDRWSEARAALEALGLSGSYADVAAAFGASDPRGPRAFALSYAAQRSALEDAGLEDLTRFAPELAHAGTSDQRDSWTGRRLSTRRLDFDPFTFFFLHWAATGGRHGSSSWHRLYSTPSWRSGGSGNWWGGGTGFGSSGGSSWGSSWGGSSGGFGGFSGGGGFSSGGGGGW